MGKSKGKVKKHRRFINRINPLILSGVCGIHEYQLTLPGDWVAGESLDGGGSCFNSADGNACLYFYAILFSEVIKKSAADIAEQYFNSELQSLAESKDFSWEILDGQLDHSEDFSFAAIDALSQVHPIRGVIRIFSRDGFVLRLALYDDNCVDYRLSCAKFDSIADSLCLARLSSELTVD